MSADALSLDFRQQRRSDTAQGIEEMLKKGAA
jgi:hypothetical protein